MIMTGMWFVHEMHSFSLIFQQDQCLPLVMNSPLLRVRHLDPISNLKISPSMLSTLYYLIVFLE